MIETKRRVYKKFAHSARRPQYETSRDPEAEEEMRKLELIKANKKYRIMRAFTIPYNKYYEAQMGKETGIYKLKTINAMNVNVSEKMLNSEINKNMDKKKKYELLACFNEYLDQKLEIYKKRRELEEIQHLIHINASVEKLKRKRLRCKTPPNHNYIDLVPKMTEKLHSVMNKKNKILSEISLQRRDLASFLQKRLIQKETVEKALHNLSQGKVFLNDIIGQAMLCFKEREDSLVNAFKGKTYLENIEDKGKKNVQMLQIRYDNTIRLAQFYTIKNQTRVIEHSDEDVKTLSQISEKEKSLQKYLDDTFPFMAQVFTFFSSNNMDYIQGYLVNTWNENFHIFSLAAYVGALVADSGYQTMLTVENVDKINKQSQRRNLEQQEELNKLHSYLEYMSVILNLHKTRLKFLQDKKKLYMNLIDKMLKTLSFVGVLDGLKRWDTLDTAVEAMRRIEKIGVEALNRYKKKHPQLYYMPYIIDSNGKKITIIPKDLRLKQKAYDILLEHKKLEDAFKMPQSPCFFCIQEERLMSHWHAPDQIRPKSALEDKIKIDFKHEAHMCLHRAGDCPSTKKTALQSEEFED